MKGDKTLAKMAKQLWVHPTQITEWKQQLLARAANLFGGRKAPSEMAELQDAARQYRSTGAVERFFRSGAHQGGLAERKTMID